MFCDTKGFRKCKNMAIFGTKCKKHAPKCPTCSNPAIVEYCDDHGCSVNECGKKRKDGSRFCNDHACKKCVNKRMNIGKHCSNHTCSSQGCGEGRSDDSVYCRNHALDHRCHVSGCAEESHANNDGQGDYCTNHKCDICLSQHVEGGQYCEQHTCADQNCTNQHADQSAFCMSHKCTVCKEKKDVGSNCKNPYMHQAQLPGTAGRRTVLCVCTSANNAMRKAFLMVTFATITPV